MLIGKKNWSVTVFGQVSIMKIGWLKMIWFKRLKAVRRLDILNVDKGAWRIEKYVRKKKRGVCSPTKKRKKRASCKNATRKDKSQNGRCGPWGGGRRRPTYVNNIDLDRTASYHSKVLEMGLTMTKLNNFKSTLLLLLLL